MSSAFSIDFLEPTSGNFLISGQTRKVWLDLLIFLIRPVIKFRDLLKFSLSLFLLLWFNFGRHGTLCIVQTCMTS